MKASLNHNQGLSIPDSLSKAAYQVFQDAKVGFSVAHKSFAQQIRDFWGQTVENTTPLAPETLLTLRQRQQELFDLDWQEAKEGVYPESLLFEADLLEFLQTYPNIWLDLPQSWQRQQQGEYKAFDPEIDQTGYPKYYLRNFHYQTNGYLSEESADLYDLQVDLLFNGGADAMRRRVLKPLKQKLSFFATDYPRILDVACGTGRSLKMLRATFPKASLYGLDLSPAYLKKANELLSQQEGNLPQLIQGNGESLPFKDDYFQGVVNIFLFHELPPTARQKVIDETYRVLQSGGVFIICDSIQKADSPEFETLMNNFPLAFHEPYYNHYITDNMEARLNKAGFVDLEIQHHLASKYWIARKPI